MTSDKRVVSAIDIGASGGKVFYGTFEGGGFELNEIHRFVNAPVNVYLGDTGSAVTHEMYWKGLVI